MGMECRFSLVRYVPDAVRNEFINIGVVVEGGGARAVRFTRDWSRVRCLDPDADIALLEALEEELRAQAVAEVADGQLAGKPLWDIVRESFSSSVQLSETKGCLADSVTAEVEELLRLHVEATPRVAAKRSVARGRTALVQKIRGEFERAGVWPLLRKRIRAAEYTRAGDPLQIDCGYRPNGLVRMFHAVSVANDTDAAKVLAYTLPQLAAGVARVEKAQLELTAVIEPRRQMAEDDEAQARYGFSVEVMERAGLRVLTANDLARVAETAREELRV
jgi:hypothetical protein